MSASYTWEACEVVELASLVTLLVMLRLLDASSSFLPQSPHKEYFHVVEGAVISMTWNRLMDPKSRYASAQMIGNEMGRYCRDVAPMMMIRTTRRTKRITMA